MPQSEGPLTDAQKKYHHSIIAVLVTLVVLCLVMVGATVASALYQSSSNRTTVMSAVGTDGSDSPSAYASDASKSADDTPSRVVKVGFYESRNFLEGADDSKAKGGFGYEYLQRVAAYSSWKYEYVYGTWDELYKKLKKGEIDLLPGVARTDKHKSEVGFPSISMLNETFYVYKRNTDESIRSGQPSSLDGKRVGAVEASNAASMLDKWLASEKVEAKEVVYPSTNELKKAWAKGAVDVIVSSDNVVFDLEGAIPADMLGKMPFYLAVAKGDSKLLSQLNGTLGLMNAQDRTFLDELEVRYSTDSALNTYLTAEEQKWTRSHSKLRVGYLDDYLPFSSATVEGNPDGLFLDVLNAVFEALPGSWYPTVETTSYASQADMVEALRNDQIDLAFPVAGDTWYAESRGYLNSSPVISPSAVLVAQGGFDSQDFDLNVATDRISVNRNNQTQEDYVKKLFPDAEIVYCSSVDECLLAVKGGRADCTILDGLRAGAILNSEPSFVTLQLPDSDPRSFAVAEGNGVFLQLLNRGLSLIGNNYGTNAALQHTSGLYKYTVADFVRDNLVLILVVLFVLAMVLIFMLGRHFARMRRETEHEIERNKELKEALDQAEKAGQARDVLLRNLSHDIRTPLNGILGLMEKLEDEPTPGQARIDREKAKLASNQLLRLVDNLLEMSRLKTGDLEFSSEVFSLDQLFDAVVDHVAPRAEEQGVAIRLEKAAGFADAPKVKGSPLYVGQVLDNVIDNAIRFNRENGQVIIHAEVSAGDASELPGGDGVLSGGMADASGGLAGASSASPKSLIFGCSIKDTGNGMDEESVSRLFEPFFQANSDSRSEYHGSGLGMPIVRALIDLMGGSIGVSSKEGEGTKVVISLPFETVLDDDGSDEDHSGKDVFDKDDDDLAGGRSCDGDKASTDGFSGKDSDAGGASSMTLSIFDRSLFGTGVLGQGLQGASTVSSGESKRDNEKPLQGICCLVAEDNELNLELVQFFLERVGAKVLVARDGREALESFAGSGVGSVDVVLMDIMMPEMDGCESARAIRALDRADATTVPIIALTANVLEDDRRQVLESGMNEHLPKPIDSEKLVATIKQLLQGRTFLA